MSRWVCKACGKSFRSKQALAGHVKAAHGKIVSKVTAEGLDRLASMLARIEERLAKIESMLTQLIPAKEVASIELANNLPSFAKDNPWIEVLSKRHIE